MLHSVEFKTNSLFSAQECVGDYALLKIKLKPPALKACANNGATSFAHFIFFTNFRFIITIQFNDTQKKYINLY